LALTSYAAAKDIANGELLIFLFNIFFFNLKKLLVFFGNKVLSSKKSLIKNLFFFKILLFIFDISLPVMHIIELKVKLLKNSIFLELEKMTYIFLFSLKNSFK